jgi:hypothetical protein
MPLFQIRIHIKVCVPPQIFSKSTDIWLWKKLKLYTLLWEHNRQEFLIHDVTILHVSIMPPVITYLSLESVYHTYTCKKYVELDKNLYNMCYFLFQWPWNIISDSLLCRFSRDIYMEHCDDRSICRDVFEKTSFCLVKTF